MNPDWDGIMKARAREPKPPKEFIPIHVGVDVDRAIGLLGLIRANVDGKLREWATEALAALGHTS